MARHFVIENLAAYRALREEAGADAVWRTTSPAVLVGLAREGAAVRSLEQGLEPARADALARACHETAWAAGARLNRECAWRGWADLELVLAAILANGLYVSLYKSLLLQRLADEVGPGAVCVGDPDNVTDGELSLAFGRLDTLYARLARMDAAAGGALGLSLALHRVPEEEQRRVNRGVTHRAMGRQEKLLSLLLNTPGSFLFKLWKNLLARRLWPGRTIGRPGGRSFLVYKECELLDEAFLGLLARGGRVGLLGTLPGLDPARTDPAAAGGEEACIAALEADLRPALAAQGLDWVPGFALGTALAGQRLRQALALLAGNLESLAAGFDRLLAGLPGDGTVLTSGLFAPVERLFSCHCRRRGIRVAAFEHGVTLGLSEWSRWGARYFGMRAADLGFYHNRQALEEIALHCPEQRKLVAGVPEVTRRVMFPRLSRRLARRWLGLGREEHAVCYVANLDRNNAAYGPHIDNDLSYMESTREIVLRLLEAFPGSRVALKLYPSQRYLEHYGFEDLAAAHSRLLVVKDADFRFIRSAMDLIFVASSQSTLGWCLGSGKPVVFVELAAMSSRLGGVFSRLDGSAHLRGLRILSPRDELMAPRNLERMYRALFNPAQPDPDDAAGPAGGRT